MAETANPSKHMAESGGISLSLFNPFSTMYPDTVERYPQFFADMFAGSHPRTGWLAAKISATALLGAALFGAGRGLKWLVDAGGTANDSDPAKGVGRQVGTTFKMGVTEPDGEKRKKRAGLPKKSTFVPRPDAISLTEQAVNVMLPAAALIAAGLGTFSLVDSAADKAWTAKTEKDLKRNKGTVQKLVETRARLANGNASDKEVERALAGASGLGYVKKAAEGDSDERSIWGRIGDWISDKFVKGTNLGAQTGIGQKVKDLGVAIQLLTLGAGVAAGVGAYKYFSKNNENNIRYKAYKRALQEYARLKTEMTPITMSPDEGMVKRISAGSEDRKKDKQVRDQPEAEETRRPMMLTLD